MTAIDPMPRAPRVLLPLPERESLRLLSTVSFGRIVFTDRALPAIRPVNHVVYEGDIVICVHDGSSLLRAADRGVVVAYEADNIDPDQHLGWSVVVTGLARVVDDPAEEDQLRQLLRPWVQMPDKSHVVRIHTNLVSGFELVAG